MRAIRGALAGLFVLTLAACATRPPSLPTAVTESLAVPTDQCLFGCPTGAPAPDRIIRREAYTLANNGQTKFADWVAYKVVKDAIGSDASRSWKADSDLPATETLEPLDYKDASETYDYDRGHQAPLASFAATPFTAETNLLSNITPQKAALNQGRWKALENAERKLAKTSPYPIVFVVTGPLYERDMPGLPKADEPLRVPSGYWKVVALADGRVAAFIFDQMTPRAGSFCEHLTTVFAVEALSRLDIMPQSTSQMTELAPALGCTKH